jgi:oligoribonuclease (3'-5' exoribonuclease)
VLDVNDRVVWIDCEMTGLDLRTDALVEVAALVTDFDLTVLGDGIEVVISLPRKPSSRCLRSSGRCTPRPGCWTSWSQG